MKKKKLLFVVLVLILILGAAVFGYNKLKGNTTASQTTQGRTAGGDSRVSSYETDDSSSGEMPMAPDFTVYTKEGQQVNFRDYVGKPIVLNFWASWCPPCRGEMPCFNKKYQSVGDQVQFFMINVTDGSQETVDRASAFVERGGYSFPVFYDKDASASRAWQIYALPATYFIDTQGRMAAGVSGAIDEETLDRDIDLILD